MWSPQKMEAFVSSKMCRVIEKLIIVFRGYIKY